jgi:hypothetical protein
MRVEQNDGFSFGEGECFSEGFFFEFDVDFFEENDDAIDQAGSVEVNIDHGLDF